MTFSLRSGFGLCLLGICLLGMIYLFAPLVVVTLAPLGQAAYLEFPPHHLSWHWYGAALHDAAFLSGLWTSVVIGFRAALVSTVLGMLAAYGLTRYRFRGAAVLEAVLLSPLILPTLVLAIALTLVFSILNVSASLNRLVAAHVVICIPYVIRAVLPTLQRFDRTLEEAACNLGASPLQSVFLVLLPVIRPAIVAGMIMAFITSFDEVILALFLSSPGRPTLSVLMYSAVQYGFSPTIAAVSGLLVMFTVVVVVTQHVLTTRLGK